MRKAVIFDVDGTLLDTTEGILSSVKYTIEKHKLPELTNDRMLKFIGPPIQDSFARAYGLSGDILQELATTFRNRYKEADLFKAVPYEGIYKVCDRLKELGVPMAIATYKREDYAIQIMKHFGFDRYTNVIYGADHENQLKKTDIIRKCLDTLQMTRPEDAVMVGDSDNDAIGAEVVGTDFIGVIYGFGFETKEEVLQYKHAVGAAMRPEEILEFV